MLRSLAARFSLVFVMVLIACEQTPAPERGRHPEPPPVARLDPKQIEEGAEAKATVTTDGVVRIAWARTDVAVEVDGMPLRPFAGLGSWAGFKAGEQGAMVMFLEVLFGFVVHETADLAFPTLHEAIALGVNSVARDNITPPTPISSRRVAV